MQMNQIRKLKRSYKTNTQLRLCRAQQKSRRELKHSGFETHGSSLQKWPHPIMSERELYFIEIKNEKLVFIFQVSVPGGHLGDNEMVIMFFQLISFVLYQPRGYET